MAKLIKSIVMLGILVGVCVRLLSPSLVLAQVNSYELFWPKVSGRTMADKFYSLKSLKEKFQELLNFGTLKKANFEINISEKRVLEAESLVKAKKPDLAAKTLFKARSAREKTQSLIKKAEMTGFATEEIRSIFSSSLKKQFLLLKTLGDVANEDLIQIDSLLNDD